jgi:hypothetical protein
MNVAPPEQRNCTCQKRERTDDHAKDCLPFPLYGEVQEERATIELQSKRDAGQNACP